MSESTYLHIAFCGPALDSGEMDVKELAPALLAVGDLLDESNRVINSGRGKIGVNVKGSFKTGSFGIDFSASQSLTQQLLGIVQSDGFVAAKALLEMVGLITAQAGVSLGGLIWLIKKIRNRKIKTVKNIGNGKVVLELVDGETIEERQAVIELLKSYTIRKALEALIYKPLSKEGITAFAASENKESRKVLVNQGEHIYFFAPPVEDELIGETLTEIRLMLVSISFKEDNKWRFSDGSNTFYAVVNDGDFLARVHQSEEAFSKNDILTVQLKRTQWLTEFGIKTEHEIEKVLEHRSGARQLKLF